MPKLEFEMKVTLGNVLMLVGMAGTLLGVVLNNERRLAAFETRLALHELRLNEAEKNGARTQAQMDALRYVGGRPDEQKGFMR